MRFFYNVGIYTYLALVNIVAFFDHKAQHLLSGRKNQFEKIRAVENRKSNWIWFHAASLGEFEQARPIIEKVSAEFTDIRILITFYSPSGFETRKNYEYADFITYLPFDTTENAYCFIQNFNISLACFVKSEYWLNYLLVLKESSIPAINFSAQFRSEQLFFKPWASFYKNFLFFFNHILVQNEHSEKLLLQINYPSASVTGDTRFDRVLATSKAENKIPSVSEFKENKRLVVFGSVWQEDLELVMPLMDELILQDVRLIIAPHEVEELIVKNILKNLPVEASLFSRNESESNVLVIDTIGHLASIYQYADLAFIGGAFRGTLHNVLEPIAFGVPVLLGKDKRNKKFPEAINLVNLGAAKEVSTTNELKDEIELLMSNDIKRNSMGQIGKNYIDSNSGASEKTMKIIRPYLKRNN